MKIGIPKALLYHRYGLFWERFFFGLGHDVVLSGDTDVEIFKAGQDFSIDENCVPCKIFAGHTRSLIGKCDRIFIPRIASFEKGESVCVKFNALYDIMRNTFKDEQFITCNVDGICGKTEKQAYIKLGTTLGAKRNIAAKSFEYAKFYFEKANKYRHDRLERNLSTEKIKIMIAANAYNSSDLFSGGEVALLLKKAGVQIVFSSDVNPKLSRSEAGRFSSSIYWTFTKETLGAVAMYEDRLDGVVFLTAFPCGQEALANELVMRKLKIPSVNIVIDSSQSKAGLVTRLESFVDMLTAAKQEKRERINAC